MKKILCSIALMLAVSTAFGQDKLVRKAQSLIEENKLDEAQTVLTEALTSGKTKKIALAWDVQGDIYQRVFAAELNKAAASQPLDTMKFAKNLYACIDAYEKCNELDEDKEFYQKNKGNAMKFRTFYMYCGQFFFNNRQYSDAFTAYDKWLTYPQTVKLVENEPKILKDSVFDENQIAYYACLAAYNDKNYQNVEKYINQALKYDKELETVRQLRLTTYLEQGDTANWVKSSKEFALSGVKAETVAQNLLAYYLDKKDEASALAFADELLAKDPNSKIGNYSKGVVLFGQNKFADAVTYFVKTTEIDPTFSDAFYNAGVCYCNEGYALNEKISNNKKLTAAQNNEEIKKVKAYYEKALPFFLKVKELEPDNVSRWASRLSTVYYIMGDKAKQKEMDALLKM
jgi:tetratricopeptide (TPR) repeat protein